MVRSSKNFPINNIDIKLQALAWGDTFAHLSYLDSNGDNTPIPGMPIMAGYDCVIAIGCVEEFLPPSNYFEKLREWQHQQQDWVFGLLSYDLKNDLEQLCSENIDRLEFPAMYFFRPLYLLFFNRDELTISAQEGHLLPDEVFEKIKNQAVPNAEDKVVIEIKNRVDKQEYIQVVNQLKQHIHQGNIYEVNYCMEFYAEDIQFSPLELYLRLMKLSPTPFSAYCKINDKYLLSASPERYLKKQGTKLLSQPIKGTIKRGETAEEDAILVQQLHNDPKEQAENVMIVDLVRNDLSRTAAIGSVQVDELMGIYSFQQVHQMISTVSSELADENDFVAALTTTFPMGSMTGAPKIRAMQLIEKYEKTRRGLYSGAVGYIAPNTDFDFNVVIRSILYNAEKQYLSFMVGSAITANALAEVEYDECLLKARAMMQALNGQLA